MSRHCHRREDAKLLTVNKKIVTLAPGLGDGQIPPAEGAAERKAQINRVALSKKPPQQ